MSNTAIEWHARNRPIVECEVYDRGSTTPVIVKRGIFMGIQGGKVLVSIPTANTPRHSFNMLPDKDGFGYEGSMHAPRGWRIKLDQLKKKTDGVPDSAETGAVQPVQAG